jgi:hypothetical protein
MLLTIYYQLLFINSLLIIVYNTSQYSPDDALTEQNISSLHLSCFSVKCNQDFPVIMLKYNLIITRVLIYYLKKMNKFWWGDLHLLLLLWGMSELRWPMLRAHLAEQDRQTAGQLKYSSGNNSLISDISPLNLSFSTCKQFLHFIYIYTLS